MAFLRNPEIKRALLFYTALCALAVTAGFLISYPCGIFALCVCAVFTGAHFIYARISYRRIAALACDIDALLHGGKDIDFACYSEGELAILQNELDKLTLRLKEQNEALLREKLRLVNAIADISHQLRTPLTSINLLISLLRDPLLTPERRLQLSKELEKLIERIDWLVASLLTLSRFDAEAIHFKSERVRIGDVIQKSAEPLAIPMELREQSLIIEDSGAAFMGDLAWTAEALGNILKNCMEHTPPGGTITLATEENALYTQLIVTDTGSGLDPKDIPHLFERFYKGRSASPGSAGIGLALARVIVTGQDGTIKAENYDGGARFIIRFYKGTV
jgi:signal transduction histidine kinase